MKFLDTEGLKTLWAKVKAQDSETLTAVSNSYLAKSGGDITGNIFVEGNTEFGGEVTFQSSIKDDNGNSVSIEELTTMLSDANSYTDQKIATLVNSAPATLDTLGELATALQSNQSVVNTLNTAITDKANSADLDSLSEDVDELSLTVTAIEEDMPEAITNNELTTILV